MAEPVKPFACMLADCGMTFTNEDHLHVHTKKHDMVLQLGSEQKASFVADQTPTPTRFIRNCEEVGLFQDLQNVAANPFDEGFKRAMETTKAGLLSLETTTPSSDDVLHTPQMVYPLLDNSDPTLFNTQRNIAISRSSSDESGTIKEFETRTISKLTNEVTTISRIVNTDDVTIKHTDIQKDVETVSYKNNVITIESNVVRKDVDNNKIPILVYTDAGKTVKDNLLDNNKLQPDKLPIMSQKSIDFVVDSLTSDLGSTATVSVGNVQKTKSDANIIGSNRISNNQHVKITRLLNKKKSGFMPRIMPKRTESIQIKDERVQNDAKLEDYEVVIKLPGGKQVKMKPVVDPDPKQVIRNRITKRVSLLKNNIKNPVTYVNNQTNINNKTSKPMNQASTVNMPAGTLIPVTLVNQQGTPLTGNDLNKVPITKIADVNDIGKVKLPTPILTKIASETNTAKNKIMVMSSKNLVRIKKPKIGMKTKLISKPCKIASKDEIVPPTANEYLTEEDVVNKIEENRRKEELRSEVEEDDDIIMVEEDSNSPVSADKQREELERRCAASKRYRERLKYAMRRTAEENRELREWNQRLIAEKAVLKLLITEHMKCCPHAHDMAQRLSVLSKGGNL